MVITIGGNDIPTPPPPSRLLLGVMLIFGNVLRIEDGLAPVGEEVIEGICPSSEVINGVCVRL